jgi:uncharacterized protein (TIGR02611 family)
VNETMTRRQRILRRTGLDQVSPVIGKTVVGVIGITVVLLGLLLIFLPGPGLLIILIGLGILATEFVWASQLISRGREVAKKVGRSMKGRPSNDR